MKPLKNNQNKLLQSLSFKFLLALLLVAIVPVGISFFIFEQISDFNQRLQKEAVDSIDGVSEIYKSYMRNESERILLLQRNISLEIKDAWRAHHAETLRDLLYNTELQRHIQTIFDDAINENRNFFDIRLTVNRIPIIKATSSNIDRNVYEFHAAAAPLILRSGDNTPALKNPTNPAGDNDDGMMIIETHLVDSLSDDDGKVPPLRTFDNVKAQTPFPDSFKSDDYLPSQESDNAPIQLDNETLKKLNSQKADVELVILIGVEKAQTDLYERLGEKRFFHRSLSKLEADQETNITDLYKKLFFYVALFVFMLSMGLAIGISLPMTRRLSELARVTQDVANGNLNAKVTVRGNDQLACLMSQFNDMVDDVRKAQESKAYIERMQAWQEVARRLAHEIKNPLTPIVLSVQQLDRKFDDYVDKPQKYRKLLDDVVEIVNDETKTLRKLVKNFSEFARMPIPETKPAKLCDFVQQIVSQNPQFTESANLNVQKPAQSITDSIVDIDLELMRRVFINLIRNGIEAAQNANIAPVIDISFDETTLSNQHAIAVSIADNGPGLTDEQKSKLFMPYFTTKADGTGLGLSIVRKIVEEHHGSISLNDRIDGKRGAQAIVTLPVISSNNSNDIQTC